MLIGSAKELGSLAGKHAPHDELNATALTKISRWQKLLSTSHLIVRHCGSLLNLVGRDLLDLICYFLHRLRGRVHVLSAFFLRHS